MLLLKNIRKNSVGIVLALSILSHIFLLNFNSAEWGDSYRILRAAQLSRTAFYPVDEKRPPLFSLILSLNPEGIDPILFGRYVMAAMSILSLIAFYLLAKRFIQSTNYLTLALLLFWLNPVYLYWSLRIYADVPFSLFVLCFSLAVYFYKEKLTWKSAFILGFLGAFSVFLRFEGYLLIFALWASLLFKDVYQSGREKIINNLKPFISSVVGAICVLVPFILYRNPLVSSYLMEPVGRTYNLETIIIFLVSLIFSTGFLILPAYFYFSYKKITKIMLTNTFISFFILFSLILILFWPAAIPRLFVSVIPFLIIFIVISIQNFEKTKVNKLLFVEISAGSIFLYVVSQYVFKLQFMIVLKPIFLLVIVINLLCVFFAFHKRFLLSNALIVLSALIWSCSTLWIHKDIYKSLSEASKFISTQYQGLVVHNDINSVADWYLNYDPARKSKISGKFLEMSEQNSPDYEKLKSMGARYVLVTNEHNVSWYPDFSKISYLEEIKVFRYNVNSGNFFTGLYKIEY